MKIACVLFDLDDTLYPAGAGLMREISERISRYVAEHLDITLAEADTLRLDYYQRYGSSVRSLVLNYHLNVGEFLAYAHDVDIEGQLSPDADLDCLLECVQSPRVLFTNAPGAYAQRVLRRLGIERRFEQVFGYEYGNYVGKPDLDVYRKVQTALAVPGEALVMVDDNVKNLFPARILGWRTVWVQSNGQTSQAPSDYVVRDLWQVAAAFQELGIMDRRHRVMAEHRLAGCAWANEVKA